MARQSGPDNQGLQSGPTIRAYNQAGPHSDVFEPAGKGEYVDDMENRANDTPLGTTLRETRALVRSPRVWAVLAGVIAILSLTGPFDTYGEMSLVARVVYWTLVGLGSFGVGLFCSMITATWAERRGLNETPALLLGGVTAGVPISALNAAINRLVFGDDILAGFRDILPVAVPIAVIIAYLYELPALRRDGSKTGTVSTAETGAVPALVRKLPPEIGRDIVHLQAQDHYVKVTTTKGSALVLMPLGDAARDLAGLDGLRSHRSWWVRKRHVAGLVRRKGRLLLRTSLGDDIPVGRAYRGQILRAFGDAGQTPAPSSGTPRG